MAPGLMALILAAVPAQAAEPAVGRLNLSGYRHREMCTASLVAPDKVLTAAHCVTMPQDGRLKRLGDMTFVAGWDGQSHGGAARVAAVTVHPQAYREGRLDLAHDVALVTLARAIAPAPLTTGSGGLPGPLTLMGYQKSAPHRLTETPFCYGEAAGTLWRIRCRVEPGQSGGPVFAGGDASRRIVAVISAVSEEEALAVPLDAWLIDQLTP
ncbi:trypsin-like serine protease [Sagittula sp. M10.9X]|uniref:Trypsin-like serine protease n=2 Tax=Sagittula salina TaxID=2820268 RepID=A0A940MLG9_9RHOB|nr:trypsin-like serine protease [Sagittula salina]